MIDIKQIANDCGIYFHDVGYAPIEHTVPREYSEICFQKFACKIISECLDVVRNIEYPIDELHDMIQEINLDIDQKLHKKDLT